MIDTRVAGPKTQIFWQAYLASVPHAEEAGRRFYEVFRIGDSPEGADEGATLIKQGLKTATSSLLWTYQATSKPLPEVGSLSIVTDGRGDPVCVVETLALDVKAFADVGRRLCVRLRRVGSHPGDLESPELGAQCSALSRPGEDADAGDAAGL